MPVRKVVTAAEVALCVKWREDGLSFRAIAWNLSNRRGAGKKAGVSRRKAMVSDFTVAALVKAYENGNLREWEVRPEDVAREKANLEVEVGSSEPQTPKPGGD